MSYDMTKMHDSDWAQLFNTCRQHRKKLLNPFYSRKHFISDIYEKATGQKLDFKNPKTFNEKLNASKIKDVYYKYADKHGVREYVAEKIGSQYLIPEFLYVNKLKLGDFQKLPEKFVLKTTNGSGTNYIVKDKSKENLEQIATYMNRLVKLKYGYLWGEFLYNRIRPGIIAEELLLDNNNNIPDDLKCYCFKGNQGQKHKIFYIERVIGDDRHRIMFDEQWREVDYGVGGFKKLNIKIQRPKQYEKILEIVDKLSEDFNFVRVDLFLLKDKIYFGELTFIPTAGFLQLKDKGTELLWGKWIGDDRKMH